VEPTEAISISAKQRLLQLWDRPHTAYGWFATVDHKALGIRYLFTAFCFLLIGGVEALLMRIQLARPEKNFLTPEMYDQIFSMLEHLVPALSPYRPSSDGSYRRITVGRNNDLRS
jgi:hypothetical protein